jgi:RimJ/RimL family protein N-acetyltransferase
MEPDLQPTLVGECVELRPVRAADWPEMFAAASDPLIWEVHPVRDRYREPVFREYFEGALASRSALAILDRNTGRIIGSSRYHGHEPDVGEIEIGWTFLTRARWGGDINREVKRLMLEHAFRFVDTVIFMVGEHITARSAPWRRSAASSVPSFANGPITAHRTITSSTKSGGTCGEAGS